ncbi:MAG TPA: tRNA pseudouridine(38-40) synthase TruA [Lachnospiraceae bacterium]|nr:tRNA pseudouridine(38-40) synthase TruA [Lachnospiraceae bacterium]
MKRVLLVTAYDGTDFAGFQAQKSGVRTVEGVLNQALGSLTGERIEVIGASRTDAGVHALCNLAVFDTDSRIPGDKFAAALNTRLPEDVKIQESFEVDPDFHPRHCMTIKTYEYRIYNAPFPSPVYGRNCCYSYTPFDTERMRRAADCLTGTHDFKSFCSVYSQALTTVRTITGISVTEELLKDPAGIRGCFYGSRGEDRAAAGKNRRSLLMPRIISIRVSGTGFLYNMVRIIAGTLMEAGRGAIRPEDMPSILAACDRRAAGPTAPARGLTLVSYRIFPEESSRARSGCVPADPPADLKKTPQNGGKVPEIFVDTPK